ncbi:glucuronate isomerase [Vibrio cyclitrophicus]|uniref:glucuronate isomerase n=1 Tax=Vibrio cyclitrophicus TaxID=47951 RepID=UPI00148C5012|nr:glucuronate isomerase [Vibrio cyclitrophicus]NOI34462.1 glucuronate isomerase [Vibrio cyclitrophicus]
MFSYIHKDFLLQGDTAKRLYHDYAAGLPIIDYHNHLDAKEIYDNHQYDNIAQAWLSCDHYLWRALRSNGVNEYYITGDASDYEKFQKWCETMPYLIGNPLYHWCHLELKKYFGLDLLLNSENCAVIWQHCNQKLSQESHRFQSLLKESRVDTLCTTDDPLSDLSYHDKLNRSEFSVQVLPTFRADSLIEIENQSNFQKTLNSLAFITDINVVDFASYAQAITSRVDYFAQHNCRLSDLGLKVVDFSHYHPDVLDQAIAKVKRGDALNSEEISQFKTAVFEVLGKAYHKHGWSMQIHIGVLINVNKRRFDDLGGGTGFSVISDNPIAENLSHLLSLLDQDRQLPQTIVYSLNPKDSSVLGSIIGAFQDSDAQPGKVQLGSAWWFNDHKAGMEKQLQDLANLGALGRFVGMLTDSRSVLSLSRHDYFRRILCNLLGKWVDDGELPNDEPLLKQSVENICYQNAKQYFNFHPSKDLV